ncbi:MAG: hypothetical protein BAA01_13345 [Bacillus thermozeamaize]|uniref:Uncharacterized protein n=1 Tax=Bacillus thermozeamaize TaxID=230954 RepID=A0A1Y3PNV6_9BACI|nr:MAG: hypothetical protein BAA01_13345 [Bacillus thermozeamaize]
MKQSFSDWRYDGGRKNRNLPGDEEKIEQQRVSRWRLVPGYASIFYWSRMPANRGRSGKPANTGCRTTRLR